MNVLIIQIDGKLPNIACMRIAAHHRRLGDGVEFKWGRVYREFGESFDRVYASSIFEKSASRVETLRREYPGAIVGGTGVDVSSRLESIGIETNDQDYSIYPKFKSSIGFTQRGCRLKCKFCVVPKKKGDISHNATVSDIWRGDDYPRELLLFDNDFFGNQEWQARIDEIRTGSFKVAFSQGINARFLNAESAKAIASVDYRDDSMKVKRIYTAWDNRKDQKRLFSGLNALVDAGVKPDHIMVYMLVGYWNGPQLHEDDFYRVRELLAFGARPYPMPFVRNRELVGFQRWVIGAYAKRIPWGDWEAARYEPRNLRNKPDDSQGVLFKR